LRTQGPTSTQFFPKGKVTKSECQPKTFNHKDLGKERAIITSLYDKRHWVHGRKVWQLGKERRRKAKMGKGAQPKLSEVTQKKRGGRTFVTTGYPKKLRGKPSRGVEEKRAS